MIGYDICEKWDLFAEIYAFQNNFLVPLRNSRTFRLIIDQVFAKLNIGEMINTKLNKYIFYYKQDQPLNTFGLI